MAGQEALVNFLNTPAPGVQQSVSTNRPDLVQVNQGKAAPTQKVPRQGSPAPAPATPGKGADKQTQAAQKAGMQAAQTGAQNLQNGISAISDKLTSWADAVPTPGGIGLLLFAIFFLIWAIVPVNGDKTRLQLLWLTLTGRTRMAASPDAGGTYTDTGTTGTGSGGMSNGHSVNATADLLSQLNIRDWGNNV